MKTTKNEFTKKNVERVILANEMPEERTGRLIILITKIGDNGENQIPTK